MLGVASGHGNELSRDHRQYLRTHDVTLLWLRRHQGLEEEVARIQDAHCGPEPREECDLSQRTSSVSSLLWGGKIPTSGFSWKACEESYERESDSYDACYNCDQS